MNGIWRHRKGNLYLVLGVAKDSSDEFDGKSRFVVVYVGLNMEGASAGTRMFVRDLNEFLARFTRVGLVYDPEETVVYD